MPPRSKYARPVANRVFTNRERPIALFNSARSAPDRHHLLGFYGIGGQGKTALGKKLRQILADESPQLAVWGQLNFEEIPFRETARGLLQLRNTLRESGRIRFTAFDVAIAALPGRAEKGFGKRVPSGKFMVSLYHGNPP
jgi:hypothetical protein